MNYFSYNIFLLLYCGVLLIIQPDSATLFFIISLALSVLAVMNIVGYIINPSNICVYNFFATSLLLAYALSTFATQIKIYSLKSIDVARYFSIDQSSLSQALAGVSFASAVLVCFGRLIPFKIKFPEFSNDQIRESLLVVLIVAFVGIYSIWSGLIGFQGFIFADATQQTVSPTALMVSFSLAPAGVLAMFLATGKQDISHFDKRLFYIIAIVIWAITFTQARRLLVYLALLYVIFYAIDNYGYTIWKKKIFFSVIVVFVAYFGVKLFYAFRVAGWESPGIKDTAFLLKSGFDVLFNPSKYDFNYLLSENTIERPFVIKYLAQVLEKIRLDRGMSGEAIYATILFSIPSLFIGVKTMAIDEDLIHPRLGLVISDDANTILTTGAADFGWAGLLLYPVLIVLVLKILQFMVRKVNIRWLEYFVQFGILFVILNVENSMSQYWSFVRNSLIVLVIAFALRLILNGVYFRKNGLI